MTIDEWIEKFNIMVEDELDEDYQFQLANDAMHEVEEMAVWEVLKKSSSFSASTLSLPSDFDRHLLLVETGSDLPYEIVPFEQQDLYDDTSYTFYIDWSTSTLTLTDSNNTVAKKLYYQSFTDDLTTGESWGFPTRFHSIVPYKMAEIYYATDAGEKARSWDDRWSNQYERMLNRMYQWNDSLKTRTRRRRGTDYNPKAINNR